LAGGGVPGSSTLTAILETKDARIQTLERQIQLLEMELQRIKDCGGRLREQLLRAVAVPSGGANPRQQPRPSSTSPLFAGTGVTNPFAEHLRQQQCPQHYQRRNLKPIELGHPGLLALHPLGKHDFNFKRQVSFFIGDELIDKNDG
jgi:hypothetical protein